MRLRVAVAAVTMASVLGGCGAEPLPDWHQETGFRWRELAGRGKGQPGFTAMAPSRTGVTFQNSVSDSALIASRVLAQGAGVALGDVDGDGLLDLFLARTEGPNALYRNRGGWRFEEIAGAAGVDAPERASSGAAFADLDGDGDLDLLLLAITGANAVFLNDGAGRFSEQEMGLEQVARGSTTPAMADVDGDGDLDLFIANYRPYMVGDSLPPQQLAFNQVVRELAPGQFQVRPELQHAFKIVMNPDGRGGNLVQRAEPDAFYLREGGRYVRVPLTAGDRFRDARGEPLKTEPESFGLGARFADLNGDGAPDLYVANDFEEPDALWLNDGTGRLQLADWTVQRQTSNSGMAVDVGDVNGDGLPDLYEVDMLSNDSRRLKTQMPTHIARPKTPGDVETQVQMQRNVLFLNRGDGTFQEVSRFAGVHSSGWSWSTMFLDVDLDGWQDILIATGHTWDVMDADTQERLQNRLTGVPWQRQLWEYPRLELRNVAYRNRGDLTYEDVSERWRFGVEEDISHTFAAGDLDGDGDLDVVVNRLGSPALVLRNDAPAPRIAVRLVGDPPNTCAVGATIRVLGGAVPLQEREVVVGGLYMSHSDYLASFATGAADSVTITVTWRDGRRSVLAGARPNRLYEITGEVGDDPAMAPAGTAPGAPPPLFEDATPLLGGHRHHETPFDDWNRQFLLPNALSQLGPGVAWFDFDRDGDEDLAVGAGRGGRLATFRNEAGRLVPYRGPGALADEDFTTVLGLARPGSGRLLIGVSNWEARSPDQVLVPPAALSLTTGPEGVGGRLDPLLPPDSSATGPLALGDYDGDGDLDLFVGGRALPAFYPRAASSGLFRNTEGRFVPDSEQARVLDDVGLVSAAVFADVDGDGDPDLLLAREWGSILLLLNEDGRLAPAPASWGLERWSSRWNGIATGDLDGDGRLDIVATSWGRNIVTQADSVRPLFLLHGQFGTHGEVEMLLARDDPRLGALVPLNSYARVRVAIPNLSSRIRSFAAYADATVDHVLGPISHLVQRLEVNTLDHMVFLNRGGRFEGSPLPAEAQLAPAFHASIADFDGDGFEDVFLSQNFFPTEIGTPRYDTGRGLLMLGDGTGALRVLPGVRSGIVMYGDQRGAAHADFDGDGRLDLVVSQNAAATRLFHNRGATPGLRVRVRGPAANPDAVGTQLRLLFGDTRGPLREIQAGSGYWSQNGAVQVFGIPTTPTAVWIRWPGGKETQVPVPPGATEVVVAPPAP